jgi:hypothetical protein
MTHLKRFGLRLTVVFPLLLVLAAQRRIWEMGSWQTC